VRTARHDSLTRAGISPDSIRKLERTGEETAQPAQRRRGGGGPTRLSDKAGLNRFAWDLHYPDAVKFNGMIFWAGDVSGPVALPGRYTVRLTAGGVTQTAPLDLVKDPRSTASQRDMDAQFALLMRIRDTLSAANNAVRIIRNVRDQITLRGDSLPTADRAGLTTAAAPLLARLATIEDSIYQTKIRASEDPLNFPIRINNKIAALGGVVASGDGPPTAQSDSVFRLLTTQLDVQLRALHDALQGLGTVNAYLQQHGARAIVPSTAELHTGAQGEDEGEGAESD
jgi:hypothetical protein